MVVAIYLDTNQLYGWRTFAEMPSLALAIVADQVGQRIVLPELVVKEAEAQFRRTLESAVERRHKLEEDLMRLFEDTEYVMAEPEPQVGIQMATWRRRLEAWCDIAAMHPDDAVEALLREIVGKAPAKERGSGRDKGGGARDAAIWLTILRDHRSRAEEGHFVTRDRTDFLRDGKLKRELRLDVAGTKHALHVYGTVDELLARLGEASDSGEVKLAELTRNCLAPIRKALEYSLVVPAAVFMDFGEHRYRTDVLAGEATSIRRTRRYVRGDDSVTIVDAHWRLTVDCEYQELEVGVQVGSG